MTYLLDTNVISEIIKREPSEKVVSWFKELEQVTISSVTLEELTFVLGRVLKKWIVLFARDTMALNPLFWKIAIICQDYSYAPDDLSVSTVGC